MAKIKWRAKETQNKTREHEVKYVKMKYNMQSKPKVNKRGHVKYRWSQIHKESELGKVKVK